MTRTTEKYNIIFTSNDFVHIDSVKYIKWKKCNIINFLINESIYSCWHNIKKQNFKVTGADPSVHEDNDKLFQNTSFCDSLVEYFTTNVNKKNM